MPSKSIHKILTKEKLGGKNAEELYNLVLDVENYKNFLPYCNYSHIFERFDGGFLAEVGIGFGMFKYSYKSEVHFWRSEEGVYCISVNGANYGSFKKLLNKWEIQDLPGGNVEVSFLVDFELKNPLLNKVAGGAFEQVSLLMMRAFYQRMQNS